MLTGYKYMYQQTICLTVRHKHPDSHMKNSISCFIVQAYTQEYSQT